MKSGYFSLFLQLSLFLSLLGVHLCALCLHRGFCAVSLCKDALVFAPAKPVYYGYSNQQNAPQKTAVLCDTGKGEFIMARVYNFSAGPSMLPEKVLRQAQAELLEYGDSGQSVMEMSHRSKWFDAIITETEATLRRVMNIPDNYKVGFFQGGATQQFAMVPLNFMTTGKADYLVTGNFSNLAAKEAAKFGEVKIVASSKDKNFTYIPDVNAIDYDKDARTTRLFFQTVQNKLHYAVHRHTAAELIVERADAAKEHMGLATWENAPDGKIVKADVTVAKNYLSEKEMSYLERIVSLYLDYAELQAERKIPMSMEDWAKRLDGFLEFNGNELLTGPGKISAEQAKLHAETEFEKYRIIQDRLYESDFDRFLMLEQSAENSVMEN